MFGARSSGLKGSGRGLLGGWMCWLGALGLWACGPATPVAEQEARSAVAALAGTPQEGFARALEPREFVFPEDHGAHPDYATEWWYFTGHLDGQGGERFGYQLTFFRSALAAEMEERGSAWASRQVYLAHFALSELSGKRFHSFERSSRGGAELAGARADPFAVWLEDWQVEGGEGAAFPWRVRAKAGEVELHLQLSSDKEPVLHGDRGLSHKGSSPGSASYYFSYTRMAAEGRVVVRGQEVPVQGSSWLDREWSTSVLEPGQTGWDWFSLQMEDGRELMAFELRRSEGGVDTNSHGTLVAQDGSTQHLAQGDYELEVLDTWQSDSGIRYPSRWRLQVPAAELDLEIRPLLADQELDLSFRYWEGAVEARGTTTGGEAVTGRGYVELVGYEADTRRPGT